MKKMRYLGIASAFVTATALTGCSGMSDNISNNLGATRENGAYDYNYDYSGAYEDGEGLGGTQGAGYWDYYGINGTENDKVGNDLTGGYIYPNTVTDSHYGYQDIYGNNGRYVHDTYGTSADNNSIALNPTTVAN